MIRKFPAASSEALCRSLALSAMHFCSSRQRPHESRPTGRADLEGVAKIEISQRDLEVQPNIIALRNLLLLVLATTKAKPKTPKGSSSASEKPAGEQTSLLQEPSAAEYTGAHR